MITNRMAQQGKQIKVGAREDFAYRSVVLILLANGNRYEGDFKMRFEVVKPSIQIIHYPVPTVTFLAQIRIFSLFIPQLCFVA